MKPRITRNPFHWLLARHWPRLVAAARVSAYLVIVFGLCAALSARAAWGAIGEASLSAGRQMDALRDVLGSTKTLSFNGQQMFVSTAVVHMGVEAVLDRFQTECGRNPSGLSRVLSELATPRAVAADKVLSTGPTPFGILRKSDVDDGIVVCLADHRNRAVSARVVLEELVRTRDVSVLGDMMYVFAKKVDGERTHVITTWTSGPFKALDLFPETGDAPGSDSTLVARPIASRRILSGIAGGAPYGVRVYESTESHEKLFAAFDATMAERGWTRGVAASIKKNGRVFIHPSGVLAEVFASTFEGKTIFSTVEMGRMDPSGNGAQE